MGFKNNEDIFNLLLNWDKDFYKFTRDEKDMYPYTVNKNEDGSITIVHNVLGLDKKDVNITTTDNGYLVISGETKDEITGKVYSIDSKFNCAKTCDLDDINCKMRNGLLYITIGAKKEKTPAIKTIKIN